MSNDWIEHNGGPQPVADDVWVEAQWAFSEGSYFFAEERCFFVEPDEMEESGNFPWEGSALRYRILNDHLIDAARLEGIRLGLEAAAKEVGAGRWRWTTREENLSWVQWSIRLKDVYKHCEILIRNLNPETIAQEAQHD